MHRPPFFILVPILVAVLTASCSSAPVSEPPSPVDEAEVDHEPEEVAVEDERDPGEDLFRYPIPARGVDGAGDYADPATWAAATLETLSLRQKIGQMVMPWVLGDFAPEGSASHERIMRLVDDQEIGGVIISSGTPLDVAAKLNTYQRRSNLPLLVAADLETGAGFRMRGATHLPGGTDLGGATQFPSLMALGAVGDPVLAYEMGRITAQEARAVGIHVPFAPVLDVNNNVDNPIINTRAFGEDPELVASLGSCFVRGIQDYGAIATGKHFPGHGDTDTDSHLALPVIRVGMERMERIELLPFQRAIDKGMGAVMTAHIALPEITEAPDLPATLSWNVLTGLLRERMGFDGLVFTDAMDMNAIDRLFSREEAAVLAVEAGADILLMPPDPEAVVRGLLAAVLTGRVSESRIDASVVRILRAKAALGLHLDRTVDLEEVHRRVGLAEHEDIAREIAERSLTLLTNQRNLIPLLGTRTANVLSITYRRPNDLMAGRSFDARLRSTYPRLRTAVVGRDTRPEEYERLLEQARGMDLVVVSLHITAVSYAGSVAAPDELVDFVRAVSRLGRPNIVVSFGNPYLLEEFPDVQSYLLAWSGSAASQRAAAGALVGEIAVRGRTPTRIPPTFAIGHGLQTQGAEVAALANPEECG